MMNVRFSILKHIWTVGEWKKKEKIFLFIVGVVWEIQSSRRASWVGCERPSSTDRRLASTYTVVQVHARQKWIPLLSFRWMNFLVRKVLSDFHWVETSPAHVLEPTHTHTQKITSFFRAVSLDDRGATRFIWLMARCWPFASLSCALDTRTRVLFPLSFSPSRSFNSFQKISNFSLATESSASTVWFTRCTIFYISVNNVIRHVGTHTDTQKKFQPCIHVVPFEG